MRFRATLDTVATCLMLVASVVLIWAAFRKPVPMLKTTADPPLPTGRISLDGVATIGSPVSRLAIIEYSDFECPFCATFTHDVLPALKDKYIATGKALLAFVHLPLAASHPSALRAAIVAECARRQNRFWDVHDELFEPGPSGLRATVDRLAADDSLAACVTDARTASAIRQGVQDARHIQVSGTPTFLIGIVESDRHVTVRRRVGGVQGTSTLFGILDDLLKQIR